MDEHIRTVIDTLQPYKAQVRSLHGHWLLLNIRPYKDVENRIDGAVLSLTDVTQLKEAELEARAARDFANAIIEAVEEPLLVLDRDGRIIRINRSFSDVFDIRIEDSLGLCLWELGSGEWDIPALRELLQRMLARPAEVDNQLTAPQLLSNGVRSLRIHARRVGSEGLAPRILLAVHAGPPAK